MIKIKRIKLSGFRGILIPKELNLRHNGGRPTSIVLFGLNSSGKTSFVDGIEWFLCQNNEIEWLKREDAGVRAYPHQEAKDQESYVEVEFYDSDQQIGCLTKVFNHKKITKPDLSSPQHFEELYNCFIIRPYLRYLDVIDFVYNRTGAEKYQKLASWMGFEDELSFQEKIALKIIPAIRRAEQEISILINQSESSLKKLIAEQSIEEKNIVNFCNLLIKPYAQYVFAAMDDVKNSMKDIEKLKSSSKSTQKVTQLIRLETIIGGLSLNAAVRDKFLSLKEEINALSQKKELVSKIDSIELYSRALNILTKEQVEDTQCPVCGVAWKREEIIAHIKQEMAVLKDLKDSKDQVSKSIVELTSLLRKEEEEAKRIVSTYEEAKKIIPSIGFPKIKAYQDALKEISALLNEEIFEKGIDSAIDMENLTVITKERDAIKQLVTKEKNQVQPSKEELKLNEDIEKLKRIYEIWESLMEQKNKLSFFKGEIDKIIKVCDDLSRLIQQSISQRFKDISFLIGKYFGILRQDKDIKDIEIVLNLEKGRAAGRSAEIQLSYYNISVKPAYKVLSESLLNSLGLAIYFACIKQFNRKSKFIVLDDIMNSLDVGHRDTLLDLIEQEFIEHQIVLFTHDLFWFEKIQRRFPDWITKKIKGWEYSSGPKIDFAKVRKAEIEELLQDSTKVKQAGFLFGEHLEGILNELCEDLQAEVRHRFVKHDPASMEELFTALYKRLKSKLGKEHPVVNKVTNAKKYEPLIRNFSIHPKQNYPAAISPEEIKRAIEEWYKVEEDLFCSKCNSFVRYIREKDTIECKCDSGGIILTKYAETV